MQYAGEYYVVLNWWVGNYVVAEQIYHKVVRAGDSATFNYSGTIDNTTAKATGFDVFLLKYGDADFMPDQGYEVPEACVAAPTTGTFAVRAYNSDTGEYLGDVAVSVGGRYIGRTLGLSYLIFTVIPGYHTISLSKTGYKDSAIYAIVGAGESVAEDGGMEPEVQLGRVNVTTVDAWTDTPITGAKVYADGSDTGKTTPCTIDMEPSGILGYQFIATKDHFAEAAPVRVITAGENNVEMRMQALGMQCNIDMGNIEAPDIFPPPPIPIGLPSFGFRLPFTAGEFTYYGIGWLASLHTPAPHHVTDALIKSMVVKVNGETISLTPKQGTDNISFDLFTILQSMDLLNVTALNIEITYATQIWFDTFDYGNTAALETTTQKITIPIVAPGFCSFVPVMSGPAEIPITIPFLPTFPIEIGDSVLDIDLGAACKNLTSPTTVPIRLFLFGSSTPAIDTSVSATPHTLDLSSYILPTITTMIGAGTLPASMDVLLQCPEEYKETGFSSNMTETGISIPLSAPPPPAPLICTPSISNLSLPELQLTMTAGGVPGIPPMDPVTFAASMGCKQDGVAIDPTFPFTAVTRLHGDSNLASGSGNVVTSTINVGDGSNEIIDLAMDLLVLLVTGKIDPTTQSLKYEIEYPLEIVDGVPSTGTKTVSGSIGVSVPAPGDIFCNLTAGLTAPDTIPLGATGLLPPGTPDPMAYLDLSVAFCDEGAPTNPLSGLYVTPSVGGVSLGNLYPDSTGRCTLNLANFWSTILSTIASGASTIDLSVKYPKQVKYSTPTVQNWGTLTKTIDLDIPGPPGCELTADDHITCDDGTTIPIRMCLLDGSKVDIIPTPTCPDVPAICGLTADDYITCDDGSVIPIRMCLLDGSKVDIIPTPTCPGAPADRCEGIDCPNLCLGTNLYSRQCVNGVCVIDALVEANSEQCGYVPPPGPKPECTESMYFTCPDGTEIELYQCIDGKWVATEESCPPPGLTCTEGAVKDLFVCPTGAEIYLKKCENNVWVDTGESCPDVPECTDSEYFTCPDGTEIELYKCVGGKRVATGNTCPKPPPPPAPDSKMVYVLAPLLSRVGKKITITGMVYCGTKKVGGEKAWITINGELLTTMNTSSGKLTATWTPVVPGLYTICATVPGSSACNAAGSSCTTIQVVAELTAPEIAAAEAEFESAKERIGQIMERI